MAARSANGIPTGIGVRCNLQLPVERQMSATRQACPHCGDRHGAGAASLIFSSALRSRSCQACGQRIYLGLNAWLIALLVVPVPLLWPSAGFMASLSVAIGLSCLFAALQLWFGGLKKAG